MSSSNRQGDLSALWLLPSLRYERPRLGSRVDRNGGRKEWPTRGEIDREIAVHINRRRLKSVKFESTFQTHIKEHERPLSYIRIFMAAAQIHTTPWRIMRGSCLRN